MLRRARPSRLRGLGGVGDDDRLIGMMMIRDEDDVLGETLAGAVRWFDRIYVLDGTTDPDRVARTDAILAARPEVCWHARDADWFPEGVTDGARQVLLDRIRRDHGVDNWIGVLHADEFLDQDPRPMLAARHPALHPSLRVRVAHAFLHPDDEHRWSSAVPMRQRVRHTMWPGVPESRFFFDDGSRDFDVALHSKVIPRSHRPGELVDGYVIVQYNERDPDQLVARARSRAASGWQVEHYARVLVDDPDVFVPTLDRPDSPFAPEFAGDPEGPFVARSVDSVPTLFRPDDREPVILARSAGAGGPDEQFDLDDRTEVDLSLLSGDDGLLATLDRPTRPAVWRWSRRVRDEHGKDWPPGADALLRHTAAVLRGPRVTAAQREVVAGEFLRAFAGAMAGRSWFAFVDEHQLDRARHLLSVTGPGRRDV